MKRTPAPSPQSPAAAIAPNPPVLRNSPQITPPARPPSSDALAPNPLDLKAPHYYINRELSWLAFNERVLEEAEDPSNALLERLKFLAIFSSNLDEFFQVRVAAIREQALAGVTSTEADGMTPAQILEQVRLRAHELVQRQYRCLHEQVLPRLAEAGLVLRMGAQLTELDRMALLAYFREQVFPTLTPMAVDPAHPFPHLPNLGLCIAVLLEKRSPMKIEQRFAIVPLPGVIGRLIPLTMLSPASPTDTTGEHAFTLLGEIIQLHLSELFCGLIVREAVPLRVTRNTELDFDEDAGDLLAAIEAELRNRNRGAAVRLEIDAAASDEIVARLIDELGLTPQDVYRMPRPLDLNSFVWPLVSIPHFAHLRDPPHTPAAVRALSLSEDQPPSALFDRIAREDVLVHHPYESFAPVVDFLNAAAEDPDVLAIKQTLYRTNRDSPVLAALERAARRGKQVTALMELKARFDEENNIAWARRLEQAGVHVVYGLVGLKTHCKVALVVRREGAQIRSYLHLATGNYNASTARLYTDVGLFTASAELGQDAMALFNMLTGYGETPVWNRLAVAPMDLHDRICAWIDREAAHATRTGRGQIIIKVNSLVEPQIIRRLYRASQAGVQIDLIVRGICCLRPGVPGVSETIRVRSILDRFLEHSRIFYFHNAGKQQIWVGSADLMPRNLFRRVEVLFPVDDARLARRVKDEILWANLQDTQRARVLQADGHYVRCAGDAARPLRMQYWLAERAEKSNKAGRKKGKRG
mgnify:CR=1 FL=1